MTATAYDIAIVGGGVNGAGIARDAAGRGARVLLLEAGDLASGTSSASTKLIHGGLRYLEYKEFALVREALQERDVILRIAPHLARKMRFVLPHVEGLRPRWMLRAGLFIYDHLGGFRAGREWPNARTVDLATHPAGYPLRDGISHGFEYSDGWIDDARLVVLNVRDAADKGAEVRTHTTLKSARRDGAGWVLETDAGTFHADALVNAAGPAADDVARLCGEEPAFTLRRVRGSHIITRRLFDHGYAYIFQMPDTRIVFAIPYERDFTLIGTTDRDHTGALVHVSAADDEVAYLCDAASHYFRQPVTRDDVITTYAGVRALIDDGSGRPEAATRGYRLSLSDKDRGAPLLGVWGGKITSYRHVTEAATNLLAQRIPALAGAAWTAHTPLPGGDFAADALDDLAETLESEYGFLSDREAARIARSYGTRAAAWLGKAKARSDLGRDFGAGLSEAEVDYLTREEWAMCSDDVLWRRTKLGIHMTHEQRAALADYMGG
ncbi:MAG: glycerol-3-phosphate dehydrogenase [Caenibius sp.]